MNDIKKSLDFFDAVMQKQLAVMQKQLSGIKDKESNEVEIMKNERYLNGAEDVLRILKEFVSDGYKFKD